MSQQIEVPVSTLSKVERDELTLSYPQLRRMIDKLALHPAELFTAAAPGPAGWRSIQRAGATAYQPEGGYEYGYPCAELRQKRMTPVLIRMQATLEAPDGEMFRGAGEEYVYVLSGRIAVSTELYSSVVLEPGDSVYLDSRMKHTYAVAAGCPEASALLVCCEPRPE